MLSFIATSTGFTTTYVFQLTRKQSQFQFILKILRMK